MSGFHDESLSSYVNILNFLLATYVTEDVIHGAVRSLARQLPGMAPKEIAKKIYTEALSCSMVDEEKRLKSLFAEKLEHTVCENVGLF